jgi:hypothetical protein
MTVLEFLAKWEPVWLFLILAAELCIGIRNWFTLEKEYEYDKWFNEEYLIPKKRFKQKKVFQLPEQNLTEGESK